MKKLLFVFLFVSSGILTSLHAQYYNYNTTTKSQRGYSTNQSYYSNNRGETNIQTNRQFDGYGGYNSSTSVYNNGEIKSLSTTTSSPYGGTTTIKQDYQTGSTTYKYNTPKTHRSRRSRKSLYLY